MTKARTKNRKLPDPNRKLAISDRLLLLFKELKLIVLVFLAGYLFIALFSYTPQNLADASSAGFGSNLGGTVGAWIAAGMFSMIGGSAYLFLFLCGAIIFFSYWKRLSANRSYSGALILFTGIISALMGSSGLESLYFSQSIVAETPIAGGLMGELLSSFLYSAFGVVGASLLLLALVITGLSIVMHISWFAVMDRIGYEVFRIFEVMRKGTEVSMDRVTGLRTKKQRSMAVKEFEESMRDRKAPSIVSQPSAIKQSKRKQDEAQESLFDKDGNAGGLPELSLLDATLQDSRGYSQESLEMMSRLLVKKLKDFNVEATVEEVQPGPVITRFEIELSPGIKASLIVGLSKDLARSLSVASVRVVENIPGKTVIGIEVPNQDRETVRLMDGLSSDEYERSTSPLTLVLGKDIAGNPVVANLMKMPHVLIAGTTGSGKSVCVNALILSILYKSTPEQVRMIMVDPKFLELSVYDGIPHLLTPVVTDMNKATNALRWCIGEMDRRFRLMATLKVRNISGFNRKVEVAIDKGEPLFEPDSEDDEPVQLESLPYIVVIVDELADLMMVAGKKVEEVIIRIAQRARAAGIHLVLATQRPSVDVVTGLIKANIPTRIAFQVSSKVDSRTVLDQIGAEALLGQGDMLFLPPGSGFTQRVHGSFVSDQEVGRVVAKVKKSMPAEYREDITEGSHAASFGSAGDAAEGDGEADPLYDEAVSFVTKTRKASISAVQRALRVGYNRAARMIESMEQSGVVSAVDNGKRTVLAPPPP
ncbi:MAG: DNA translocase FtsK 4TM domain-containing protein [Gammaproteobacteria bacterium]|nr:DNA translocase FtsK 4TM domain-containing protein [Gammaproteobacteria bacterium]